jgi:REP element-mobilizing transposase RayT
MARGVGGMTIFTDDRDHRHFEFLLELVVEEFKIECWGYCGMGNHYHAIVVPTLPNISAAMQMLNGEYGQWWNHRHRRRGHVFQDRFKDQIVQNDEYLMTLIGYVARNPHRARLVDDLSDWQWGTYRALAGLEPPPRFLSMEAVLARFGAEDGPARHQRFQAFVADRCRNPSIEARFRSRERVVGDAAFKKLFARDRKVTEAA